MMNYKKIKHLINISESEVGEFLISNSRSYFWVPTNKPEKKRSEKEL